MAAVIAIVASSISLALSGYVLVSSRRRLRFLRQQAVKLDEINVRAVELGAQVQAELDRARRREGKVVL